MVLKSRNIELAAKSLKEFLITTKAGYSKKSFFYLLENGEMAELEYAVAYK